MLGFLELLNTNFDKYDTATQKEFLSLINSGMQNTHKLLENLLLWSNTQRGKIKYNPQNINLYLLSNENTDLLTHSAEKKLITIKNQVPKEMSLKADKDMLSSIIRNLVSNALKFTSKGGEISIKARAVKVRNNQNYTEISIKDNGVGIPKVIQPKLFLISENTSTEGTDKETGSGLGLIICKEFIEKHGGKIWVESEEGKGSTFFFTISS
jgi:signal transduction histidine kinase